MTATPVQLYHRALALGLRLEARGDKLGVSPADRVPPGFADVLRQHKTALLDWLTREPWVGLRAVPPDNLPLNALTPRPTAENRERVIAYMVRQGCDRPGLLTEWLVRREVAYFDGPGRHWDCAMHAYAASRDAACWQLNRTELEVWELLSAFDEPPPNNGKQ